MIQIKILLILSLISIFRYLDSKDDRIREKY